MQGTVRSDDRDLARRLDVGLLEPTSVRAFWAASETLNFTRAARVVGMTQSGVSQHVARLERALGVPLFLRDKQQIKLTDAGQSLRGFVVRLHEQSELLRERIHVEQEHLTGDVRYAMPSSCLLSPHFALLLRQRAVAFPDVTLHVTVCDNQEVLRRVVEDDVHFGFVTARERTPSLVFEPYCTEQYVLLTKTRLTLASPEALRALPIVRYPGADVPFQVWAAAHFPRARVRFEDLPVAATMNDLSGVITLVSEGVGAAVLAAHCAAPQIASGAVVAMASRRGPVENQIYVVSRNRKHLPRRVQVVIDGFKTILDRK